MNTFLFYLRISLAVAGGWFAVVLWFLLLTVGASPLNQLLLNMGILPLMTHSNADGIIGWYHLSIMIQSILVFASGGLVAALIAKDHELLASSILGGIVVITCIVWNSYIDCRVYRAVDLFIWFDGFLVIVLSGAMMGRKRLLDHFLRRMSKRPA